MPMKLEEENITPITGGVGGGGRGVANDKQQVQKRIRTSARPLRVGPGTLPVLSRTGRNAQVGLLQALWHYN